MLLNLDKKLMGLDDTEFGGDNIAKFLAARICESTELEPIKFLEIGQKLYKDGKLEIDSSDLSKIEEFIKNHKSLILLAKGQILNLIQECRLNALKKD